MIHEVILLLYFRKKQTTFFIAILAIFVAIISIIIVIYTNLSFDLALTLTAILLLISYFTFKYLIFYFNYYTFHYRKELLISKKRPPYVLQAFNNDDFYDRLKSLGLSIYQRTNDIDVFYSISKNKKNLLSKLGQLNVFFILKAGINYHTKQIDYYLELIQSDKKLKKIYNTYTLTLFKVGDTLDKLDKDQINDIFFERQGRMNVTSINVFLALKSKQLVFLHSDDYSPTQYYLNHVDFIKNVFNV